MARLPRATFALLLALLPAMATIIGVIVLRQIPGATEAAGVALVVGAVGIHRSDP
jgi:inner membrane transporter RhtA